MWAKNTSHMKIPVFERPIGFVLQKGDWVAPYGIGATNDFIFFLSHFVTELIVIVSLY